MSEICSWLNVSMLRKVEAQQNGGAVEGLYCPGAAHAGALGNGSTRAIGTSWQWVKRPSKTSWRPSLGCGFGIVDCPTIPQISSSARCFYTPLNTQ